MAIVYGNSINLAKNELQNARIQNLGSDPASPVIGQTYFNTGTNKLRTYNGSTWDEYGTSTASGDVSQTSNSSGAGLLKISAGASKVITDYTATGIVKTASGVASTATSGTDYSLGTSALTTGILKSTTTTGALTIAVAGDFPTLNQSTTGSAATLTTPRAIYGNNFDGSAALTGIIASVYGGTGNGFTKFSGPATTEKTFTLPNASAVILTDANTITVAQGGTGATTLTGLLKGNGTAAFTAATAGTDYVAPGVTTVGKIITAAASTGAAAASILITPQSGTPTSPASGDLWNNAGIIKFYNGAATKDVAYTDSTLTGNTSGSAGSVTNALSISAELISGGASSYNGSAAKSIAIQAASVTNAMLAGSIDLTTKVTGILPSANGGAGTVSGLLKANGSGLTSAAVVGTDYVTGSSTNTFTNKTYDAAGTGNALSNISTSMFAANVIDTDGTLAANSSTRIPSQSAVVTYMQANIQGIRWKEPAVAATTGAETYTISAGSVTQITGTTVDGVSPAVGEFIVIKNAPASTGAGAGANTANTTQPANGIYVVNNATTNLTISRAAFADTATEIKGAVIDVLQGTSNADTAWNMNTDGAITLGTTALTFIDFVKANVPTATTSVQGKVYLATQAEAQAKTDSTKALTAASVADFARKYVGLIGDGSTTALAVTHGLGSQYVTAQVFDASTNAMIIVDTTLTSSTVTTFTFATAPASNAYRCVIIG